MSIDRCVHSLFGASKTAGDVVAQEYGKYFGMKVGIFRGGCLTGPSHSGVELHGFLSYLVHVAVAAKPYTVFGYKGKQVRDQIHSSDVAKLFLQFFHKPRCGEVYNLGGERSNSISVLETVDMPAHMGHKLDYSYMEQNRTGLIICYISDLKKVHSHIPEWKLEHDVPRIPGAIVARHSGAGRLSHADSGGFRSRTVLPQFFQRPRQVIQPGQ